MITRRNLMVSFGSAVIGASGARAEQTGKTWRIGVIAPGPPNQPPHTLTARVWAALKAGLRDLGYVEGKNLTIFLRWDEGRSATSLTHARELVRLGIDVLVTGTTSSTIAAASATRIVPIVMAASGGGDPVDLGFAKSLARPGGNITGLSLLTHALVAKRLELIKEAVPKASRVVLLTLPGARIYAEENARAAQRLGIQLETYRLKGSEDFESAFDAAAGAKSDAIVMVNSAVFATLATSLAQLALKHHLATVSGETGYARSGGLMNYGPNIVESWRRAAGYVDRILKGAKPGELPIEQPTEFELSVNLKTAKALGLTIPVTILVRANTVIE